MYGWPPFWSIFQVKKDLDCNANDPYTPVETLVLYESVKAMKISVKPARNREIKRWTPDESQTQSLYCAIRLLLSLQPCIISQNQTHDLKYYLRKDYDSKAVHELVGIGCAEETVLFVIQMRYWEVMHKWYLETNNFNNFHEYYIISLASIIYWLVNGQAFTSLNNCKCSNMPNFWIIETYFIKKSSIYSCFKPWGTFFQILILIKAMMMKN